MKIVLAVLVMMLTGSAWADERPSWYPKGYILFSCTHLPDMSVTKEIVALYEHDGEKLVLASDFTELQALVMTDRVANLSSTRQFYEKDFPSMLVDGKQSEPFTLKYYLFKDSETGKAHLKVTSTLSGMKIMDCSPIPK